MAFVGEYQIDGTRLVHMKMGQEVGHFETDSAELAQDILDAVRDGRAGSFSVAQRNANKWVLLFEDKHPVDLYHAVKAALQ